MKKYEVNSSGQANNQTYDIKQNTTFNDILLTYAFVNVKPSMEFWNYCKENAVQSITLKDYTNIFTEFIVHQKDGFVFSIEINIYNPKIILRNLHYIID